MGATEECIEQKHEACIATWCDCGCHHDLVDAHYDGKHVEPNWRCHQCVKVARGDEDAAPAAHVDSEAAEKRPNPTASKFWLGDHPRPCACLNGPCDGGENGCGYDPAAWDAWEQKQREAAR